MQEFCAHKPDHYSKVPATVIVLVHNTPDLLLQCLHGFYDICRTKEWQIIVVDNGSDEDAGSTIRGRFDDVEVIRSEQNRGFAAGNNLGLRAANGEFVILMNSDVIARADMLESLVESLRCEPQIGAMSPGLLTAKGEPQAFAFGTEASPSYMIRRGIRATLGFGPVHDWSMKKPLEVDWVSAACLCVRRNIFEEIGGLDERFPLYFEDVDWCMRMRAAGWKVVYNPCLQVTHFGGASLPNGPSNRQELYYDSLLLFCEKHYGRIWQLLIRALLVVYRMLTHFRSAVVRKTRGKGAH
jgi:N-acetylglucosaminyl-diphospho-decaprenol L-rhamnosyltransferase